jgi:hypothetical protein
MKVEIKKNTDQLNYEDFLGGVTRIVTIVSVENGRKEAQYDIAIEGDDRYWRPPATVLKQLVLAYGDNAEDWVGKSAALYGDPEVKAPGGKKVGGIRVSHLSHIEKPLSASLTVTRGQTGIFTVDPLPRREILRAQWQYADPERRAEIEAEVNGLQGAPSVSAEDAFEQPTEAPQ